MTTLVVSDGYDYFVRIILVHLRLIWGIKLRKMISIRLIVRAFDYKCFKLSFSQTLLLFKYNGKIGQNPILDNNTIIIQSYPGYIREIVIHDAFAHADFSVFRHQVKKVGYTLERYL